MGDTFAFPLWYLHFVENVRSDILLIDKLDLRYSWYCEMLKKRYQELDFDLRSLRSDPALISERFLDIVKKNVEKRAIYIPLPFAEEVSSTHLLIPEGIAHRILPKNLSHQKIMNEIERSRFIFKYRKTGVFMEERTQHNYDNYAIAYETMARFLSRMSLYNDAIFCLKSAIEIDPSKPGLFYNLGISYKDLGQLDKAEDVFKDMIKRFKGSDGYYGLGMVYQKRGKLSSAISAYKKALLIDPKKISIYYSLGACYLEKGMFDKAISQFKDALAISPNDPNLYYNLGVSNWRGGRISDAISSYKKVLELSFNYPGAA